MKFSICPLCCTTWLNCCQFGNTSCHSPHATQNAIKLSFGQENPCFSAQVRIYNIDDPWCESILTKPPEWPEATPPIILHHSLWFPLAYRMPSYLLPRRCGCQRRVLWTPLLQSGRKTILVLQFHIIRWYDLEIVNSTSLAAR